MKLAVVILNYKRTKNTSMVTTSVINSYIKPDSIYVFNNNPERILEIPKKEVIVINSEKNLECKVRHAIGLAIDASHFLFIDDDLIIKPGAIGNFIRHSEKYPEAILGYWGKNLSKGNYPYTKGKIVHHQKITEATETDVVLGRIHFCRKNKLALPFVLGAKTGEDDIALSLANKKYGHKNYILPSDDSNNPIELPEGDVGRWKRKDHWTLRNEACREGLAW